MKTGSFDLFALYKRYISPLFGNACRYYPSCSEYAKLQFAFDTPARALFCSCLRIARCNQLFKGGVENPKVRYIKRPAPLQRSEGRIVYLLVPSKDGLFYLIKLTTA